MKTAIETKNMATATHARIMGAFLISCMAVLLALCLAPGMAFAKSGKYVFDEYGVFTDDQFASLESQAAELDQTYGIGVYFLTTDTMGGNYNPSKEQRNSYAGSYYNKHIGESKEGLLFVVAVASRDYVTWGNGRPWTEMFSQAGINAIETAVTDELHDDKWYKAAQAYYREVGKQLEYYAKNGKAMNPVDPVDVLIRIIIVFAVPLVIAGLFVARGISAMRTAKQKTEAGQYLQRDTLVVTEASDRFLHTTHTATKRQKESSGGGGWGGGGSSGGSGGGKF